MRPIKFLLLMLAVVASLFCGAAIEGGVIVDCHKVFDEQSLKQDVARWLRQAAQGDAVAQTALGGAYSLGCGVPQNYQESAKWYRLAAMQGNAQAQASLGILYFSGSGVLQDYVGEFSPKQRD